MKYRVNLNGSASASVDIELTEEHLAKVRGNLCLDENAELTIDDLRDQILDIAYEEMPGGICAQCSGWDRNWSLEIGDVWEPAEGDDGIVPLTGGAS